MSSPSPEPGPAAWLVLAALALAGAVACQREHRDVRSLPVGSSAAQSVRTTTLQPGEAAPLPEVINPYAKNAWAIGEGKRLYGWYNCVGCHAHGGGGIGPALMDDRWIYGARPDQIYATIVQGRPNGMPAFAGKVPDQQVWQLVAYVQSMSGNVPKDAAPGRDDDMSVGPSESRRSNTNAKQTGPPR
jgi:cytochrome c oxidase cbb3-type subunit 3